MSKRDGSNEWRMFIILAICYVLFLMLVLVRTAKAAEPEWCSTAYFKSHELPTHASNTKRLISTKIGKLTYNNLAIGGSDAIEVALFSEAPAEAKYCTWYWGSGNDQAEEMFYHKTLILPLWTWAWPFWTNDKMADRFETDLNPELPEMLFCAEYFNYIASGCDGERHRGPTVMAWFLSVTGCTPDHATDIADDLYGLNVVKRSTRLAIAQRGYEVGNDFPEYRHRFQKVMSGSSQ